MPGSADWIIDLFAPYGPVRLKRMFGGHGIYDGDLIIAIDAFGQIWLKTDSDSQALFQAAGSKPFLYEGKKKTVTMSYWLLPDEALDDPAAIKLWAGRAAAAARRAQAAKARKPVKAKKPARKPAGKSQPARKSGTAVSRSKR